MNKIDMNNVQHIDLNLLKAFEAIMRTRSVTKAAERLSLGQPAVSHALRRLRAMFGDQLFVRGAQGMEPTPKAVQLDETVSRVLAELSVVIRQDSPFDPKLPTQFTLGLSDYIEAVLLPGLLARLQREAPGVQLILRQIGLDDFAGMLDDGTIDLAVGYLPKEVPWHERAVLFSEGRKCLFARGLVKGRTITLKQFAAHPHIVRSLAGEKQSFIDAALRAKGLSREVVLSTPRYTTIPNILRSAPLIATVPARLSDACAVEGDLVSSALPFDAPEFDVSMIWHGRNGQHPPLTWLRGQITATVAE